MKKKSASSQTPRELLDVYAFGKKHINGKRVSLKIGTLRNYENITISPSFLFDGFSMDGDPIRINLLKYLKEIDYFSSVKDEADFVATYKPLFIHPIDDTPYCFTAYLVDITDKALPVYAFGWETEGHIEPRSASLKEFVETYLIPNKKTGADSDMPADAFKKPMPPCLPPPRKRTTRRS